MGVTHDMKVTDMGASGAGATRPSTAVSVEGGATAQVPVPRAAPGAGDVDEPDVSIAVLIEQAQRGDADAFGEIYDRYAVFVYRYIYYRVGSVSVAEDLTSETFLRALRRLDAFTWQGRDIGAWFVTIARNLVADHRKSSRYRLEIATSDLIATAGDRPEGSSPESDVLARLTSETLVEAIRSLNSEQQECIVLRFLQELSVSETALAMDKSEGAIKALQYRAVRALGRRLPRGAF